MLRHYTNVMNSISEMVTKLFYHRTKLLLVRLILLTKFYHKNNFYMCILHVHVKDKNIICYNRTNSYFSMFHRWTDCINNVSIYHFFNGMVNKCQNDRRKLLFIRLISLIILWSYKLALMKQPFYFLIKNLFVSSKTIFLNCLCQDI